MHSLRLVELILCVFIVIVGHYLIFLKVYTQFIDYLKMVAWLPFMQTYSHQFIFWTVIISILKIMGFLFKIIHIIRMLHLAIQFVWWLRNEFIPYLCNENYFFKVSGHKNWLILFEHMSLHIKEYKKFRHMIVLWGKHL